MERTPPDSIRHLDEDGSTAAPTPQGRKLYRLEVGCGQLQAAEGRAGSLQLRPSAEKHACKDVVV